MNTWSLLTTISNLTLATNLSSENSEPTVLKQEVWFINTLTTLTHIEEINRQYSSKGPKLDRTRKQGRKETKQKVRWFYNRQLQSSHLIMEHLEVQKEEKLSVVQEKSLPPCLSFEPPWAPKPRTSETVTPRIPIFNRAFI